MADDSSAPDAAWFAACQPDAPCITPGTYAYLGAAAALRYVATGNVRSLADVKRSDQVDSHGCGDHV
jgi:hypothetical protein